MIKRKVTFSESHYAATNFMVKLCENTFLRQTPAYVDFDNLLVVIRDKYSESYPQNFLYNKGIFKALKQKAALMMLALARASRSEHSARAVPDCGPPQTWAPGCFEF